MFEILYFPLAGVQFWGRCRIAQAAVFIDGRALTRPRPAPGTVLSCITTRLLLPRASPSCEAWHGGACLSPRTPWGTYHQIAESLRSQITSGDLTPGAALSSEAALGQEFGVARSTVRRALAKLEAERLVKALPGTGRVVCTEVERKSTAVDEVPQSQYRRIAAELRERLITGEFSPGDALPSEATLIREYSVSRGTARQALSELEGTGLVVAVPGKGRFVKQAIAAED